MYNINNLSFLIVFVFNSVRWMENEENGNGLGLGCILNGHRKDGIRKCVWSIHLLYVTQISRFV